MLRITRRAGERIMLGNDVIVEVVEVRGGTVRLAIDAPRSLAIYREELWIEVMRENRPPPKRRDPICPSSRCASRTLPAG